MADLVHHRLHDGGLAGAQQGAGEDRAVALHIAAPIGLRYLALQHAGQVDGDGVQFFDDIARGLQEQVAALLLFLQLELFRLLLRLFRRLGQAFDLALELLGRAGRTDFRFVDRLHHLLGALGQRVDQVLELALRRAGGAFQGRDLLAQRPADQGQLLVRQIARRRDIPGLGAQHLDQCTDPFGGQLGAFLHPFGLLCEGVGNQLQRP